MTTEPRTRQFGWRPLVVSGLALLLALGGVELAFRETSLGSAIAAPDLYYQPGVQPRLDALVEVVDRFGGVDVLMVGSSVVRTDFVPLVFDERVGKGSGREVVSFNGGLSDLHPDPVRFYLEHFWLRHADPAVVIQGVRYNEVRAMVEAEGFARFQEGRLEPLWLSEDPLAGVQAAAIEGSSLLQHGGALIQALMDVAAGAERGAGFAIDARGWNRTSLTLIEARAARPVEEIPGSDAAIDGYAHSIRAEDYAFGLGVLARTRELVEGAGAAYVLVNVPEHGAKFLNQPDGQDRYAFYVEQLRAFAEREGIPFYDPTGGLASTFAGDEPFSDFHHLTPEGAQAFTIGLADFIAEHLPTLIPNP